MGYVEGEQARSLRSLYGCLIAIAVFIVAIGICGLQLQDVSKVTLSAEPGSSTEIWLSSPYVGIAAKIGNEAVPITRTVVLEDHPTEFVCQDGKIEDRIWIDEQRVSSNFRLTNSCNREITMTICWFNSSSILRLLFLPSCT
jgi:hypothetical protein